MKFIRRLYYDITSGNVLNGYRMQGDLAPLTVTAEAEILGLTNYGYFEWTEPDAEIEQAFTDSYGRVTVDITQTPPQLVFDYSSLPEPEPTEAEDMQAALEALGVEPVLDETEVTV